MWSTTPRSTTRKGRGTLADQLTVDVVRLEPASLVMTAPGDWRVLESLRRGVPAQADIPLEIREDRHFFCTVREFAAHVGERSRCSHGVLLSRTAPTLRILMTPEGSPRRRVELRRRESKSLPCAGTGDGATESVFAPDEITRDVLTLVAARFADHPGRLDTFAWPVSRAQALESLTLFIDERLPWFW